MDPNQNQMMSRSFPMWPSDDPAAAAPPQPFLPPPNRGWKRKNPAGVGYQPPALGDLQVQNRAKARRWFKNPNPSFSHRNKYFFRKPKAAAPRNTTSFIIRAKRAGGIASLVSPSPVTPTVLPTPRLSPSREGLADMAQAQWGVDGYGSMKGLIRLRRSPHHPGPDDDDDPNSSDSDVEEHLEVERRLDHDLSRFEMVYPGRGDDAAGAYVLDDDDEYDQDAHVARLEEENLTLKERLFLMEQEVGDMRRRLEALEARFSGPLLTMRLRKLWIMTWRGVMLGQRRAARTMWRGLMQMSLRRVEKTMQIGVLCAQRRAARTMQGGLMLLLGQTRALRTLVSRVGLRIRQRIDERWESGMQ